LTSGGARGGLSPPERELSPSGKFLTYLKQKKLLEDEAHKNIYEKFDE
jgi:hypothetical protein